ASAERLPQELALLLGNVIRRKIGARAKARLAQAEQQSTLLRLRAAKVIERAVKPIKRAFEEVGFDHPVLIPPEKVIVRLAAAQLNFDTVFRQLSDVAFQQLTTQRGSIAISSIRIQNDDIAVSEHCSKAIPVLPLEYANCFLVGRIATFLGCLDETQRSQRSKAFFILQRLSP